MNQSQICPTSLGLSPVAAEVRVAWVILPGKVPAITADMSIADIFKAMVLNSRLVRKGRG